MGSASVARMKRSAIREDGATNLPHSASLPAGYFLKSYLPATKKPDGSRHPACLIVPTLRCGNAYPGAPAPRNPQPERSSTGVPTPERGNHDRLSISQRSPDEAKRNPGGQGVRTSRIPLRPSTSLRTGSMRTTFLQSQLSATKKAGWLPPPGFFSFQNHSLFQNRHQAFKHLADDVRRGAFDEAGLADLSLIHI